MWERTNLTAGLLTFQRQRFTARFPPFATKPSGPPRPCGILRPQRMKQNSDTKLPNSRPVGKTQWRLWAGVLLGWLVLGVFSSAGPFIRLPRVRGTGPPPTANLPLRIFLAQVAGWMLWLLLVPAALWLRQRFPFERAARGRTVAVHLLAVVGLGLLHTGLNFWANQWMMGVEAEYPLRALALRLGASWLLNLPLCALFYALVLGLASAVEYYRQFRERELRAAQLETQLAQAQLQMLKMQLHPHFLFNTLNGITGLVRDNDNAAAVQMLVGLSELLRQTLDNAGKQEVRLSEELEWLELYLKLQQMRFSDRLQVRIVAAPETLDALVPNLIAQPLVENAIRHGLASRAAPGVVSLTAERQGERLELRVLDDGIGLPDDWRLEDCTGVGLKNTAARLQQLYADAGKLELRNRASGGVEACLSLPLRKEATRDES